jgi:hypothetical protein
LRTSEGVKHPHAAAESSPRGASLRPSERLASEGRRAKRGGVFVLEPQLSG